MRHLLRIAIVVIGLTFPTCLVADALPRSVLVIDQSDPSAPWSIAFGGAFRLVLNEGSSQPIGIYSETFDFGRFNGSKYRDQLRHYLLEKYRDKPIGVIVVYGSSALEFILPVHAEMWPTVPLVFAVAGETELARLSLPPETTGTKIQVTLRNAVRAARALVPNLKRIALVGDRFERQSFFRHYAQELGQFVHELEFIDLLGLPLADVKQRVATLPDDAAILFSSLSIDGAGVRYLSRDALKSIAEVANRPIVSETGTHIGYGSTGGFVVFPEPIGQSIARIVLRILDGERASNIPVVASEFARPVFDWRQLQRFGISAAQLPEGSEFRFRPATMWEQYRPQVTAGLAALLLQAIIISWLLAERRRRYFAQAEATDRRREVVRLNRVTTANVLSSSIAHELNQPLGAILSNTEAAQILLKANPPDLGQIGEILSDIVRDEQRASEIIAGLRNLLKNRTEIDLRTVELNDTVRDVVKIIAPEMEKRGVVLRTLLASEALPVRCDPIHLQQVMINLVVNGMDAMDGEPGPHNLTVRTGQNAESDFVEVRISDSGKGIPESNLTSIFDAFVTTKPQGTGLGLPIARTILESYGGDIWAENRHRGVVFSFRLPLARTHAG